MTANFYIVSLGPGHPELITIQALRVLAQSDVIFVQNRSESNEWKGSVAHKILTGIIDKCSEWFEDCKFGSVKKIEARLKAVYTPMSYSPQAYSHLIDEIVKACTEHKSVAYVTLGDAALFSSAYYLYDILKEKYQKIADKTEVIAGISSISYASALVKKPLCLGDTKLEVIPMHSDELKSTKVYMRLHKGDDLRDFEAEDLYYFENLCFENEIYNKGKPGIIKNYLTVLIDFAKSKLPRFYKKKD